MRADSANTLVDVIIPIHDASRSLERAVSSILQATSVKLISQMKITVVCHNIGAAAIRATLTSATADAVTLVELHDGIYSPAGPKNHGFDHTSGRYVSFVDSDDFLEPGALDTWVKLAEQHSLSAVIPVEKYSTGRLVRTPPTRPWRNGLLNAVKDRLAYRTAPLGLLRRATLERLGIAFTPDLATGEDQQFSLPLWFSAERIAYARKAPAYVVGDDATQRVTMTVRSVEEEFRAVSALIASDWYLSRPLAARRSIAVKTARLHVFGTSLKRSQARSWTPADRRNLSEFLDRLDRVAPGYELPLSIADRRLLDALRDPATRNETVLRFAHERRRFGHPATLLTRSVRGQFAGEGPPRFMAASALL